MPAAVLRTLTKSNCVTIYVVFCLAGHTYVVLWQESLLRPLTGCGNLRQGRGMAKLVLAKLHHCSTYIQRASGKCKRVVTERQLYSETCLSAVWACGRALQGQDTSWNVNHIACRRSKNLQPVSHNYTAEQLLNFGVALLPLWFFYCLQQLIWYEKLLASWTQLGGDLSDNNVRLWSQVRPPLAQATWVSHLLVCNEEPGADSMWTLVLQGMPGSRFETEETNLPSR